MSTRVVNINAGAPYDVYIGRAGKGHDGRFGNPFVLKSTSNPFARDEAIDAFRKWFDETIRAHPAYRESIFALKGKALGCFCAPKACHGDVYVAFLEGREKCACPNPRVISTPVGEKPRAPFVDIDGVQRCLTCWYAAPPLRIAVPITRDMEICYTLVNDDGEPDQMRAVYQLRLELKGELQINCAPLAAANDDEAIQSAQHFFDTGPKVRHDLVRITLFRGDVVLRQWGEGPSQFQIGQRQGRA